VSKIDFGGECASVKKQIEVGRRAVEVGRRAVRCEAVEGSDSWGGISSRGARGAGKEGGGSAGEARGNCRKSIICPQAARDVQACVFAARSRVSAEGGVRHGLGEKLGDPSRGALLRREHLNAYRAAVIRWHRPETLNDPKPLRLCPPWFAALATHRGRRQVW